MKNFTRFLTLCLFMFVLTACQQEEPAPIPSDEENLPVATADDVIGDITEVAPPAEEPAVSEHREVSRFATPAAPENAGDDTLSADYKEGVIAIQDGKSVPVYVGILSGGGYSIYAVECDLTNKQCLTTTGEILGTTQEVAAQMWPIQQGSLDDGSAVCVQQICFDDQSRVIGSMPK